MPLAGPRAALVRPPSRLPPASRPLESLASAASCTDAPSSANPPPAVSAAPLLSELSKQRAVAPAASVTAGFSEADVASLDAPVPAIQTTDSLDLRDDQHLLPAPPTALENTLDQNVTLAAPRRVAARDVRRLVSPALSEHSPLTSQPPTTLPALAPFVELVLAPAEAASLAAEDICATCGAVNDGSALMLACCDCGEAFHAQCAAGDLLLRLVSTAQAQCSAALVSSSLGEITDLPDSCHPSVRELVSIAVAALVSKGDYCTTPSAE